MDDELIFPTQAEVEGWLTQIAQQVGQHGNRMVAGLVAGQRARRTKSDQERARDRAVEAVQTALSNAFIRNKECALGVTSFEHCFNYVWHAALNVLRDESLPSVPLAHRLTARSFALMYEAGVPEPVLAKIRPLQDRTHARRRGLTAVIRELLSPSEWNRYEFLISDRIEVRPRTEPLDGAPAPEGDEADAERQEEYEALQNRLNCLSPEDQELIRMRHVDGRTFNDMGQHLGVHLGTARLRYLQALERLRGHCGNGQQ